MIMNNESEVLWKETAMAYFTVPHIHTRNYLGVTKENVRKYSVRTASPGQDSNCVPFERKLNVLSLCYPVRSEDS
jgi:hypothetical protein